MMNVFSYILADDVIDSRPELSPTKFVVEDNVGEAIHLHYRNVRMEFTIDDFETFAEVIRTAGEELEHGNR